MAALVREYLWDVVYKKMQCEDSEEVAEQGSEPRRVDVGSFMHIIQIDIECGIKHLFKTGQITARHIRALDRYLCGYSLMEMEIDYPDIETLLIQTLSLLEEVTGYTDESFLTAALVERKSLRKIKPALRDKLFSYGRMFI